MKLLIIRHADPNYEIDSLTQTGWEEAKLVADRIAKLDVEAFYVSPLGRAQDTASCTLQAMNRTATTLDWLREFSPQIDRPDRTDRKSICWDWLPQDWTKEPLYYDVNTWTETDVMTAGNAKQEYVRVCQSLDELLASYGYEREANYYRVQKANNDTLVFFCHYGVECVLLSHLLNISPMLLWHGFVAAPASVTIVTTEERREGIASFRTSAFGDTSHLYAAGKNPSFSARFCECYANTEERHD